MMRTRIHLVLAALVVLCALTAGAPPAHAAIAAQGYVAEPSDPVVAAADKGADVVSSPDEGDTAAGSSSSLPGGSPFTSLAAPAGGPTPNVLPGLNQPGLGPSTGVNPADTGGAIGPENFIQAVNGYGVAVYRRSDLALVAGPIPGGSFAAAPAGQEIVDAQFIWDEGSQRWFYSFTDKNDLSGSKRVSGILYGWSKTADPTDLSHGWCQMRIDTGADFEDRPKLSTSATHIVLGTNADPIGFPYYSRIWTIPKPANGSTSCPSGAQTGIKAFGSPSQPLKTSDGEVADSPVPAVASDGGSTVWVVAAQDDVTTETKLMIWHVNSSGDLVADGNLPVNAYTEPPLAPQPSGYDSLDTIDRRLSNAVARTDPDVGATAVWTQQVIADPAGTGRSVVRWYELIPSNCGGGTCPASSVRRQQGEVKDASTWLFNPAIAPTGAGNEAVLHYNSASSSQLTQIRASSRVSSTPLGTMGNPVTLATSDAADSDFTCFDSRPGCRWGDYTTASVDPNDPHTVWGSSQVIGPQAGTAMHWKSRNFAIQASPAPALVHSVTGAADTAPGGDADGVVEPGEAADVTETVRNIGGGGASGMSGTLQSLTQGLSVTSATSGYPDAAAGATAANSSPFRVNAGSAIACGAPLDMSLSINTAQGRYRVPVSVTTGRADPDQSKTATDVPKSIPDGNAAGVTSSVVVGGSGTVSGVDVTISRITHPWVGDLQIELIGPDGTRVVLADRPGGVNNAGDNFVNTVFSDDATTPLAAGSAPYTGTFRPQGGRLAAFDGKAVQGTWTLRVADVSQNDVGTLNGWGVRTSTASCDVAANAPPAASFTSVPVSPTSGQNVTFTSTSTDPDGSVASQAWDLDNDGQFDDGTGTTASRSFAKAGNYPVSLRVTDDGGAATVATRTVTVSNRLPAASFTASPAPAPSGTPVTFSSTSTDPDGTIVSQAWDLDDDGAYDDGTGTSASHSFARAGTYTVGLKVTDDNGGSATTTSTVTITNRAPVAAFSAAPNPVASGTSVTFTSSSSDPDGTVASQAWDLDDDGAYDDGTAATASHTFAKAGTYTVGLKVTDDNGDTNTITHTVTVTNRAPVAAFSAAPNPVASGTSVTFTSSSSDPDGTIAAQAWDLDDDGVYDDGTAATASRSFPTAGTYTVGLKVTDDNGGTTTITHTVTVTNRAPVAAFSAAPNPVPTGSAVTFTSGSTDPDGSVASQAWDLDDDGAYDDGTAATASHTFAKSGTYTVGLKVTDDNGGTNTITHTVTVTNRAPVAAFSAAPNPVATGTAVTFTSGSSDPDGSVASQAWDLDDDGAYDDGTATTASRSFPKAGTYTVGLKVTDDEGATTTIPHTVTVTNRGPVAAFSAAPNPVASGTPVTFTSSSSDPDGTIASQAWDLDDDGAYDDGSGATASRSFPKSGTYTVGLKVTDDNGGTSTIVHTVTVTNRAPHAAMDVSATPVPTGQTVTFTSTSTDPDGSVASRAWDLDDDGQFDDGTGATASRSFATAGTYTVRLRVTDDEGATDTTTATAQIDNRAPSASFTVDPASPSTGDPVVFTSTSSDPDGSIAAANWDLDDDGSFDDGSGTSVSRSFAKSGSYRIRVEVTDSGGDKSVATQTIAVGGRPPVASFTADPATVITGQTTNLDASGSTDPDGTVERYQWDLDGDGTYETDTGATPATSRFYADPGNVSVGLLVTDDDGKTAEAHRTITVNEAPPFADGPTVPPPSSDPLPGTTPGGTPPGQLPNGEGNPPPPKPTAKAPRGGLRIASRHLRDVLARGLALRFSSTEAATARFQVTLTASDARRLGLGRKAVRIGRVTKLAGAGREGLRIHLNRTARAHIAARRLAKPLQMAVTMTLIGEGGASRSYNSHAKLAR